MSEPTSLNERVNQVIEEAENEVYEEMVKIAKGKLKDKIREQKKALLLLNNINREIDEIKLEIGHKIV